MEPDQIRINIWHAMSGLYLDNEIKMGDYLHIANQIATTNYSLEEIDTIFFYEVHPVLCWNLTIPAGEWDYFDKEWLKETIVNKINAKPIKEGWFKRRERMRTMKKVEELKAWIKCDWEKVKLLIEVIRGRGLREIVDA